MAVQDEVKWLIGVIKDEYPKDFPDDLARRNRDDSVTIHPDDSEKREEGVELNRFNVVGVSSGSVQRELYGTGPQYRVNTVLDVRVEAKHTEEYGQTDDSTGFGTLVAYIQYAIGQVITYPDVDPDADSIGFITYHDARIEDEQPPLSGEKDYYRTDFSVRLTGDTDPKKGNSNTAFEAAFEGAFVG